MTPPSHTYNADYGTFELSVSLIIHIPMHFSIELSTPWYYNGPPPEKN
jgi:hypothetical protein